MLAVQAKTAFQVLHCPYPETVLLLCHFLLFLPPCFFACRFCGTTYLLSYLSRFTFCTARGRGGHRNQEVTFRGLVSCAPSRTRVVTTFLARLRTKYKNPPETSITRSCNRQNKIIASKLSRKFLVNKVFSSFSARGFKQITYSYRKILCK